MAAEDDATQQAPANVMERLLARVRERYRDEYGEDPSEEFMERAEVEIMRRVAEENRSEFQAIYQALAKE